MSKTIVPNVNKTIEPNLSNKIKQIVSKQKEISRYQTTFNTHFRTYLDNTPIPSLTTPLRGSITRNRMLGMEQPSKILFLTTDIWGSVSIANTIRTDTSNWTELTCQLSIFHLKQETGIGHSDWNHLPIRILNSSIAVPRYRWNIDNHTGMNPQGPIVTTTQSLTG